MGVVDTLRIIYDLYIVDFVNPVEYEQLNNILGQILMLVIGVELVVMLSLHKPIAVIEAMKMETNILAPIKGVVDKIYIKEGQQVKAGELIAKLK